MCTHLQSSLSRCCKVLRNPHLCFSILVIVVVPYNDWIDWLVHKPCVPPWSLFSSLVFRSRVDRRIGAVLRCRCQLGASLGGSRTRSAPSRSRFWSQERPAGMTVHRNQASQCIEINHHRSSKSTSIVHRNQPASFIEINQHRSSKSTSIVHRNQSCIDCRPGADHELEHGEGFWHSRGELSGLQEAVRRPQRQAVRIWRHCGR